VSRGSVFVALVWNGGERVDGQQTCHPPS